MKLHFAAQDEAEPGEAWAAHCAVHLPSCLRWYFGEGDARRPTYLACESALRAHMPELVPTWTRLVALAGGGDRAARMLSLFCPPPFMAACSQLLWTHGEPALIRNYDYHPSRFEGLLLRSRWTGAAVIAMVDSLWGALDGMNEHGVAVTLAFGGRDVIGEGFGVPLLLRYVLETCEDTAAAVAALRRVPCHMSYTVGVIDRCGDTAMVFLNPDRPPEVHSAVAATNHQRKIEWPEHAEACGTLARKTALDRLAASPHLGLDALVRGFAAPPLRVYHDAYATLYTAVYRPTTGEVALHWLGRRSLLSMSNFAEHQLHITL